MESLLNQITQARCESVLPGIPDDTFDMIYWDPPYFLRLKREKMLVLESGRVVKGCYDDWDHFDSFQDYDEKMGIVMRELQRVLKPSGSLWVSGTYHCAHRIGVLGENLGMWHFSEFVWRKLNPKPNFLKARPTNSFETLLWFCKNEESSKQCGSKFKFNVARDYGVLDHGGAGGMGIWNIPLCQGNERIKSGGSILHTTQKPLELIRRMLNVCTDQGDIVLDPMGGTGTTAVACKQMRREFVVIEQEEKYVAAGRERLRRLSPLDIVAAE